MSQKLQSIHVLLIRIRSLRRHHSASKLAVASGAISIAHDDVPAQEP